MLAATALIRSAQGVAVLWVVSILIFVATLVLPGNVAAAILGKSATPESLAALERSLGLNQPAWDQYWGWLGGLLSGNPGTSLANGQPLWEQLAPRLQNSAVLVLIAGVLGIIIGVLLGIYAAYRRDRAVDHWLSTVFLIITALPEFVVAIALIIIFATVVFPIFPATSAIPPGQAIFLKPLLLVLPTATLVLVVIPYIFRMTRASMIEALESDYVEMAKLKGVRDRRILLRHALPNSMPPIVQVMGIVFLYLVGGIVVVEYVFAYPGIGAALVDAVASRDVPAVQLIVILLASFYVVMNIVTDLIATALTPRRRFPR